MRHFESLEQVSLSNAWLTIGSFDGVHRGHQEILRRLTAGARASASPAVVLTFHPHPSVVLRGSSGPVYLTSPQERAALLDGLGIDVVVTQAFDRRLASTPARDFVARLVEHLGLRSLWVGYDFALGRGREGNIPTLRRLGEEFGFQVEIVPPVTLGAQIVSSSLIRATLAAGNVEEAARLLGRPYRVAGDVVHGDGRGKTIGVPTANLAVWAEQIVPGVGVYACRARTGDQIRPAAVNIGVRPTFDGQTVTPQVEAHLLDWESDLYGKRVQLDFIARLRGEQRFPNVQALVAQIHQDLLATRQILQAAGQADPQS